MNLHDLIVQCIQKATSEVFSTMLGAEIRPGEVKVERGSPDATDGVMSLIGLAGAWTGAGSISCSPALACKVCSLMLMTETDSVNEEVLDAVAELTNMIVGGVKTDLEAELGPLGLSIPTVVFGRNFKTRSTANSDWIVAPFYLEAECLEVRLCMTRAERAGHPHLQMASHPCSLDV